MSQGTACKCPEIKKPVAQRHWVVLQRRCNYSAFNGYHCTPSEYSAVQCHECGVVWRTKAAYVDLLKSGMNIYNSGGTWLHRADGTIYRSEAPTIDELDNPDDPLNKAHPVPPRSPLHGCAGDALDHSAY